MNKNQKEAIKVIDYLTGFLDYLDQNRKETIRILEKIENGFEAWLKVEFVSYCVNYKKCFILNTDVGLEYKAPIKGMNQKQIDIWVSNGLSSGNKLYHYIEFKNVINNQNKIKQRNSWIKDFKTLNRISHQVNNKGEKTYPDEIASILFGVGFKNNEWLKLTGILNSKLIHKKLGKIHVAILESAYEADFSNI